jgi:alpha-tubulin suppressor-like RCC1 family protein
MICLSLLAGSKVVSVALGGAHSCALVRNITSDLTVMCWGSNSDGRLGISDSGLSLSLYPQSVTFTEGMQLQSDSCRRCPRIHNEVYYLESHLFTVILLTSSLSGNPVNMKFDFLNSSEDLIRILEECGILPKESLICRILLRQVVYNLLKHG